MHGARKAIGRQPLRQRIRLEERAIDFLGLGCEHAVQADGARHGSLSSISTRAKSAAADQALGIGSTGMTSTDSPGKSVKCGCPSNSLAAASCDSARTTMNAPISLLTSSMPRAVIFFVL